MGADAIELSISAPIGTRYRSFCTYPDHTAKIVGATVKAVDIPVLVKLSYEASFFPEMLQMIYDTGAQIVTAIDALKGLNGVDVENSRTWMPTYGGLFGGKYSPDFPCYYGDAETVYSF